MSLEKMIDKTDNSIYKLVILASRRAAEIAEQQQRADAGSDADIKATVAALKEIAENKIKCKITRQEGKDK